MNSFRTIRIGTGDHLLSKSGRALAPVPRLALDTDRKCKASLKRLREWLLTEAREECRSNADDYALTLFSGLVATQLSPSDVSLLNEYLFGHCDGATQANVSQRAA